MKPRLAVFIGVAWIINVIIYFSFPYLFGGQMDYAGITMLLALSLAMSIMFYVLLVGTPADEGPRSGPGGH